MKLATFTHEGWTRVGLVDESEIVDLAAAVPDLPQEMGAFLRAARLRLSGVWLEAPVQRPGKLITIVINYKELAAEAGRETPQHPPLNFRLVSCINAPYGDMWLPSKSEQFYYELEFSATPPPRGRSSRAMWSRPVRVAAWP